MSNFTLDAKTGGRGACEGENFEYYSAYPGGADPGRRGIGLLFFASGGLLYPTGSPLDGMGVKRSV